MKELSVEEKARRYDEAIEIARKINDGEGVPALPDWTAYEVIFPELKESEDERIRKIIKQSLKSYFEGKLSIGTNDVDYAICLSWLKKQEEDTYDYKRVDLGKFDERIREFSDMLEDKPKPYWDGWYEAMDWIRVNGTPFEDEKQGEQKPVGCPEYCVMSNCANCPYHPVLIKNPNEWSEEDKEILDDIILCGERHCYLDARAVCWLKSLKDKVQPKQEWKQENTGNLDLKHRKEKRYDR